MAAQENMHNGELFGKVLSVNLARARSLEKNKAGTSILHITRVGTCGLFPNTLGGREETMLTARLCRVVWEANPDQYFKVDEKYSTE